MYLQTESESKSCESTHHMDINKEPSRRSWPDMFRVVFKFYRLQKCNESGMKQPSLSLVNAFFINTTPYIRQIIKLFQRFSAEKHFSKPQMSQPSSASIDNKLLKEMPEPYHHPTVFTNWVTQKTEIHRTCRHLVVSLAFSSRYRESWEGRVFGKVFS